MGMTESLMVNFENTTVKYKGKTLYILKQFDYDNKMYLYALDVETTKNKNPDEFEYSFLYRIDGDIFNHVTDDKLWDDLFMRVSSLCTKEYAENIIKKYIS